MSALVTRVNPHHLRDKDNPRSVFEWVRREGALFSEAEWDWTTDRDAAHVWPSHEAAELWIEGVRGAERVHGGEQKFYGAYAATCAAAGAEVGSRGPEVGARRALLPRQQRSGRRTVLRGGAALTPERVFEETERRCGS